MAEREPEYLGDGVYASFDGYHIWLRTGAHEGEHVTNTIALEPGVFVALVRYRNRVSPQDDLPTPRPERNKAKTRARK